MSLFICAFASNLIPCCEWLNGLTLSPAAAPSTHVPAKESADAPAATTETETAEAKKQEPAATTATETATSEEAKEEKKEDA